VIELQILAGNADACSVYTAYLNRSQNFDRLEVTHLFCTAACRAFIQAAKAAFAVALP
jgi:hypothetical protein